MRKQWFASTLFVVAVSCSFLVVVAFRQALSVKPVDYTDGNPPYAKAVEARQVTGPSLIEAIKAMGDATGGKIEDALETGDN